MYVAILESLAAASLVVYIYTTLKLFLHVYIEINNYYLLKFMMEVKTNIHTYKIKLKHSVCTKALCIIKSDVHTLVEQ